MMTDDDAGGRPGGKMEIFWMTSFVNDPLWLALRGVMARIGGLGETVSFGHDMVV